MLLSSLPKLAVERPAAKRHAARRSLSSHTLTVDRAASGQVGPLTMCASSDARNTTTGATAFVPRPVQSRASYSFVTACRVSKSVRRSQVIY